MWCFFDKIVSWRQALQLWLFWCKALALFFPTFPFNFGVLLFDAVPIWHLIDKSVSYVMSKRIWPLNSNIFKNQVPGSKYTYLTKKQKSIKIEPSFSKIRKISASLCCRKNAGCRLQHWLSAIQDWQADWERDVIITILLPVYSSVRYTCLFVKTLFWVTALRTPLGLWKV